MIKKVLRIDWREATREEISNNLDLVAKTQPRQDGEDESTPLVNLPTLQYRMIVSILWGNDDDPENIVYEKIIY